MFLFLVLFFFVVVVFFSFVSSLSSLICVFPVAWIRFILTALSCRFSFLVYFLCCLCQFSLSSALYGFAGLLKMLTLAELFERRNSIPFDKFFLLMEGCFQGRYSVLCRLVFYLVDKALYSD